MDFRLSEKEEALRDDVRAFLTEALGPNGRGYTEIVFSSDMRADDWALAQEFNAKLAQRGWIAPAWPVEYGGLGASIYEQMVINEELGYAGAPDTYTRTIGVGMIGPTLILHGSDEQKARYLPGITRGDAVWAQGYSEPGAGSDLASLQTRAVRDGDDYVINGSKIWTSGGHHATQMFCLVRTDADSPKHKGISFLILDDIQNIRGLTIRPLLNMTSHHHFNEVFFDDVRVPVANRVGEENRGWYVGMTLLDFERSGIGKVAAQRRTLELMVADLRAGPAARRARYRATLADLVVANSVGRHLGYRIGDIQASGRVPNYEASVGKIYQSELGQRMYNVGLQMLGLVGQLRPGDPRAPYAGEFPEGYLLSVPATIYSGSSEIQRNIVATRGLGLPRS